MLPVSSLRPVTSNPQFPNGIVSSVSLVSTTNTARSLAGFVLLACADAVAVVKAFSETGFTEDLKKIDVPTLVLHGEDDQIVPVKDSARRSAKLIKGAKEIYYPVRPRPDGHTPRSDQCRSACVYRSGGKAEGGLGARLCSASARLVS